jgi:hypothetical protein
VHIVVPLLCRHSFTSSSFSFAAPPQLPFNTRPSPVPEHPSGSVLPPIPTSGLPHLGHRSLTSSHSSGSVFGSVPLPSRRRPQASGVPRIGRPSAMPSRAGGPSQSSIQSADRMNARTSTPRSGRNHPRPYPGFAQPEVPVNTSFSSGSSMDPERDDRTCCVMIIPHQVRRFSTPFRNVL